jgi:hypothetical protein
MVKLELTPTSLHVHVQGFDKLWALKSHLEIPLAHVSGIEAAAEEASTWWHGVKAPGTSIPGVITAGTFYQQGNCVFWDVHHPDHAVAIILHDEKYQRLVVEVEDVAAAISVVRGAITK